MSTTILREFAVILLLVSKHNDAFPAKSCKIPNWARGECTTFDRCEPMNLLDKTYPKTADQLMFLKQSVGSCGGGTKPKVCCPPKSQWERMVVRPVEYPAPPPVTIGTSHKVLEPGHSSVDHQDPRDPSSVTVTSDPVDHSIQDKPKPTGNVPDQSNLVDWLKYWREQPIVGTCGIDSSSTSRARFIEADEGGNVPDIDQYPWSVLLEYGPGRYKCGGSLVSRSHVLTAAHCLYTTPSKVRLAEYNLMSDPTDVVYVDGGLTDSITATIMEIDWTLLHPDHLFWTSENDIGLIKMKREAEYSDFIQPICLPTEDYKSTRFTDSTLFEFSGWGGDNLNQNSVIKKALRLPYVPAEVCREKYFRLNMEKVVCAGGKDGVDTCKGDSGGPLMYGRITDRGYGFILIGIVSSGAPKCGSEDVPGVYTYVYSYIDWIKKSMNERENK